MSEKPDAESQESGSRNISVWLDADVLEAIEVKKRELQRSRSWLTNLALRTFLGLPPKEMPTP
jgi:hypothetical protein